MTVEYLLTVDCYATLERTIHTVGFTTYCEFHTSEVKHGHEHKIANGNFQRTFDTRIQGSILTGKDP